MTELYTLKVTIPAGTVESVPAEFDFEIGLPVINELIVAIPDGNFYRAGIRVLNGFEEVAPSSGRGTHPWLMGNDMVIHVPGRFSVISSGPPYRIRILGYNNHTVDIDFYVYVLATRR